MPEPLNDRIKPTQTEEHCYPVGDCTCGATDVPFFTVWLPGDDGTLVKLTYCLACHQPIGGFEPKGYVSEEDLYETEWNLEL